MSLKQFVKRNWLKILGIVGICIGLISLMLSYLFYKMSTGPPEPVFLVDPVRTIIVDSKQFAETPFRVVRPDGDEIKGDVTSVRFYFWNNGRKSIKPTNILEPLVIYLDDPNGEILDYKILKCSRKVVKPIVERNSVDPNTNLSVSFTILEKEDGVTGQIIYEGNPNANLMISGIIEGVRKILTSAEIKRRWHKEFIKEIAKILLVVGFLVLYCLCKTRFARNKPTKPKPTKMSEVGRTGRIILIGLCILFVIAIIFGLKKQIKTAQEKTLTSVLRKVPKDIIP